MQLASSGHVAVRDYTGMTGVPDLDLLRGGKAIACFCGITTRQLYHLIESAGFPVFRMKPGGMLYARRSAIERYFKAKEGRARCA
jgi:hypothetical protein